MEVELQKLLKLSVNYYQQNQIKLAKATLNKSIENYSDQAAPYIAMADFLQLQQDYEEAIKHYHLALKREIHNEKIYYNLGNAYYKIHQKQLAINNYKQALRIRPEYVKAHQNLGNIFVEILDFSQASYHFERALLSEPNNLELKINSGQVCLMMGKLSLAEELFAEVLKLEPGHVDARTGLAKILEEKGHYQKSFQSLQTLLQQGYATLNTLTTFTQVCIQLNQIKPALAYLLEALKQNHWNRHQTSRLNYLIADSYDAMGEYKKAWNHYLKANYLKGYSFDMDSHIKLIDRLIGTFKTPLKLESSLKADHLLFIIGMPRSGSTLLEQILASHPDVQGGGEMVTFPRLLNDFQFDGFESTATGQNSEVILKIGRAYLQEIESILTHLNITDKMLRNYLYLGLLTALFPGAKFLHSHRHPLDTCLSNFFQDFSIGHRFTYQLKNLGIYYQQYQRLMNHWKKIQLPILDVSYEHLVNNQIEYSKSILNYCNLSWHKDCEHFYQNDRQVMTASYLQVKRPIYKSSIGRYKNYEPYLNEWKTILELHI